MASILPGYQYDVFISYRQKDNKYDGWVNGFVDNLKKELEATFKEEISVYFDINPHDGLLETHDVDASLKEKLKCLIFIPIISRTYCDPRSFAWDHEFKAFVDLASHDKSGLKVKLPDGNVGSRILPVRIYDLDAEDIELCESVLGEMIRGIEFVYKEPGVNRPLTADDDERKNLNKTKYRNQINKTANSIKEIISGLRSEPAQTGKERILSNEPEEERKFEKQVSKSVSERPVSKISGRKLLIVLFLIIATIGAFAVYNLIRKTGAGKSMAVFFEPADENDAILIEVCDLYTESLQDKLYSVGSLTVRPRSAMLQYMGTGMPVRVMTKDLDVDYFLYGKAVRSGNKIMLWAELTSKNSKSLWSDNYTWGTSTISSISSDMTQKVIQKLNTKLTSREKILIRTIPTTNAQAEKDFTQANRYSYDAHMSFAMANKYADFISFNSAIEAYSKAIERDPYFAEAYAKRAIARAWGYYTRQMDSTQISKCMDDIKKAEEIDANFTNLFVARGFYYYYCMNNLEKAREFFRVASEKEPEREQPLFYLAMVYRRMGDWAESFNLTRKLIALEPQEPLTLTNIGMTYTYFHDWDSALLYHQKAIDNLPAWSSSYVNKIETLVLKYGNTSEARSLIDTAIKKTGKRMTESKILLDIYDKEFSAALVEAEKFQPDRSQYKGEKYLYMADIYSYSGNLKQAMIYYDSALISLNNDLDT